MEAKPWGGMDTMSQISQAAILEAIEDSLRNANETPEGALSVAEIMAETGLQMKEVRDYLKVLKAQGRLRVHITKREALDTRMRPVPVYEILEEAA